MVFEKDPTISWGNFLGLKAHSLNDKAIPFIKNEKRLVVNGLKSQTVKILTELCQIRNFSLPQVETFSNKINDSQSHILKINETFFF